MNARILAIFLSLLFLGFIIELVRRERLTFKYAAGWLLVTLAGLVCAVFDQMLYRVAMSLGFQLTSNFVFFVVICGLVFLNVILTIFLCQQNSRADRMAQKIGLLEKELSDFKAADH